MDQPADTVATKTKVHGNFVHWLQPLAGAAEAILCTECLLELNGEKCHWKAWASSPDMIVRIEQAHCHARHPDQVDFDS